MSRWAHENEIESLGDALYTITGQAKVLDANGKPVPNKKLLMTIENPQVSVAVNDIDIAHEDNDYTKPYVLTGDTQGTYDFKISAATKAINSLSFVVEGEPDTAETILPTLITFTSYNDLTTDYVGPGLPVNQDGEIQVSASEDTIKVRVAGGLQAFLGQGAFIALLVNDLQCIAMDFDAAWADEIPVKTSWLKLDEFNKFGYVIVNKLQSYSPPVVRAMVVGEIVLRPQPDARRTLENAPHLARQSTYINDDSKAIRAYITNDPAKSAFGVNDKIQMYIYVNAFDPATKSGINDKFSFPEITVTAKMLAAADGIYSDLPAKTLTGFGSAPGQTGVFYIDYEVTLAADKEPTLMPKTPLVGQINTVAKLPGF